MLQVSAYYSSNYEQKKAPRVGEASRGRECVYENTTVVYINLYYLVTFFTFSNVRSPPNPSIPINTVISELMSKVGSSTG